MLKNQDLSVQVDPAEEPVSGKSIDVRIVIDAGSAKNIDVRVEWSTVRQETT